nr:unnamed protein product [Haemonchus contortus]
MVDLDFKQDFETNVEKRDLLERRVSILKRELEIRFERIAEVNQVNMLKTVFIVCELLVIIILSALLVSFFFNMAKLDLASRIRQLP